MFWILVDGQNSNIRLNIEVHLACQQTKRMLQGDLF